MRNTAKNTFLIFSCLCGCTFANSTNIKKAEPLTIAELPSYISFIGWAETEVADLSFIATGLEIDFANIMFRGFNVCLDPSRLNKQINETDVYSYLHNAKWNTLDKKDYDALSDLAIKWLNTKPPTMYNMLPSPGVDKIVYHAKIKVKYPTREFTISFVKQGAKDPPQEWKRFLVEAQYNNYNNRNTRP